MSSEQNKATVRRIFEDGINKSDSRVYFDLLSPSYVNHDLYYSCSWRLARRR